MFAAVAAAAQSSKAATTNVPEPLELDFQALPLIERRAQFIS